MSNITTMARRRGRPTVYTEAVAAEILTRMAAGESLWRVCQDRHLPALSTVNLWIVTDREGFSDKWRIAREAQQLARVEEGFRLTEPAMAAGAGWSKEPVLALREHLNHVRWAAGRLHPRQFGDHLHLEDKREVNVGVAVYLPDKRRSHGGGRWACVDRRRIPRLRVLCRSVDERQPAVAPGGPHALRVLRRADERAAGCAAVPDRWRRACLAARPMPPRLDGAAAGGGGGRAATPRPSSALTRTE